MRDATISRGTVTFHSYNTFSIILQPDNKVYGTKKLVLQQNFVIAPEKYKTVRLTSHKIKCLSFATCYRVPQAVISKKRFD